MDASAIPVAARPRAVRRAAIFGVLLAGVGAVAVCLRVLRANVPPQLVLFPYSIRSSR